MLYPGGKGVSLCFTVLENPRASLFQETLDGHTCVRCHCAVGCVLVPSSFPNVLSCLSAVRRSPLVFLFTYVGMVSRIPVLFNGS